MVLVDELKDAPVRSKALGQVFVLFRDEQGQAYCLADTCLHRGGSLSSGKLVGNRIQCPYHGWQYNGDGQCGHRPHGSCSYGCNTFVFAMVVEVDGPLGFSYANTQKCACSSQL